MTAFNFLPAGYESPRTGSSYMKIQAGENKIRILTQPILGWEEWTKDKKPVRYRFDQKPDKSMNAKEPVRHFWSFVVWNYNEEQIQILHITQAGIRKGLEALSKDTDWGAPFFYDIKIFKEGEEMKTKYMVNPLPHKPVAPHIIAAFKDKPCLLDALFNNDDPFAQWNSHTKGIFSNDEMQVKNETKAVKLPFMDDEVKKEEEAELSAREIENYLDSWGEEKELFRVYLKEIMSTTKWSHRKMINSFAAHPDRLKKAFTAWQATKSNDEEIDF